MRESRGTGKFILGALVGAGVALLFAPQSGKETRKQLKEKISELANKVKEIDIDEVRQDLEERINQIKEDLKDLDKEKALALAKQKAEALKKKTEELVKVAKEKGTPVIEKAAEDLRQKTVVVLKDIVTKLESEDNKKSTPKLKNAK